VLILFQKFYVSTSRQLKRLESIYRSPIYSHFSTSIQGATSIRAFNKTNEFCKISDKLVDTFAQIKYLSLIADRWLGVRLDLLSNFMTFFTVLFAVIFNHFGLISSTGLVGLAVSYALNVTQMLSHAVRQISELENNIVSVERLKEYAEIDSEAESVINENRPRENWPENGEVVFENYSTRYRTGLDLAIKNINVKIEPSQKVGIVGRTGAGKSTLSLALFRMLEPAEGRIIIDGIDISQIGLHDLRSNITIIPQDPVLFSATLRFNLDPFNKFSDSQLWSALKMAHLKVL
jgi:ABC-type multidrug transport system fused ATPase/permease subunit